MKTKRSTVTLGNQVNILQQLQRMIRLHQPIDLEYLQPDTTPLDDVPSFSTDSTVSSVCHSNAPQNNSTESGKYFNDSLDRIEYMMKKGRELQQKTCDKPSAGRAVNSPVSQYRVPTPKALTSSSQKRMLTGPKSPAVKPKPFVNSAKKLIQPSPSQAVTPSTRILKPFNRAQSAKSQPTERKLTPSRASPINSPAFKKPNFPTSGSKKDPTQSRIPTSKNFNHIVSPIGAYIKNIAAPPLLANVKPTSDFFDSSYCNKMSKELDQSVMSDAGKPAKLVSSLPVKFFTASQQQRVIDEKIQKIPGGVKLNRIIGQMPSVISHQGRIHSGNPVKRIVPTDDSFANVSVMSGDISVQVVRDVKRQ
ncbi:hypothetical protein HA402_011407 [Bradysia odoriphaga]|nr:hypothetical protein HA402_011407 [Bradysia odoriphaga]